MTNNEHDKYRDIQGNKLGWKTPIPIEIYDWFVGDPIPRALCIHILLKAR